MLCCASSLSQVRFFTIPRSAARQAPLSLGILQARIQNGLTCPPPWDFLNPGIKPRCPALQADSLPAEPQGKPKNTGVGSLPPLQGNFPTQESNRGLQHCRQILYQLSYPGSPERLCTALQWRPLIYIRTKAAIRFFDPWYNPLFCLFMVLMKWESPWIHPLLELERILELLHLKESPHLADEDTKAQCTKGHTIFQ